MGVRVATFDLQNQADSIPGYTIDNLSIHKLPYKDLQCDLLDPHKKHAHACMQNLEVAVLCTCSCMWRRFVPVPAITNFLPCFGYFLIRLFVYAENDIFSSTILRNTWVV